MGVDYNPSINVSYFTGNNISGESTVGFNIPVSKEIDSSLMLTIGVNGTFTQLNSDNYNASNNIFQVAPGFQYNKQQFSLKVFLCPTIGQKGTAYLLPDIVARYSFSALNMHISAGIKGVLHQNTYEQLFNRNQFISSFATVQTHSNEVFAAIQKGLGNHINI